MSVMQSKRLGNTGLMVSEICLGAMTFCAGWGMPSCDEEESVKIMNTFADKGGNFIDTADIYGNSEEVVGRWLQTRRREDFVIATKVRGMMGKSVNDVGLSRKHIMAGIDSSLRRLQTDYIDLYQIHSWDVDTPLQETFRALDDLVRGGKVRYIGISNYTGRQLQKAVDLVNHMGWAPVTCLQPQYNLLCRTTEWDLIPLCLEEGLGVIPWSPLAGGWLTGKFKKETEVPTEGSRVAWAEKVGWKHTGWKSKQEDERTWDILETLAKVSAETGKSQAQVALRWLIQKPGVTAPIIGARSVGQLVDNLGCVGWTLSTTQMEMLDKASEIPRPYPWGDKWNYSRI